MDFQKVQAFVNGFDEADSTGQQQHGTDATMGNTTNATGVIVINMACGKHGPLTTAVVGLIEPPLDPSLAISEFLPLDPPLAIRPFSSYDRFHSKSLHASGVKKVV
jgi:hypothetical protein